MTGVRTLPGRRIDALDASGRLRDAAPAFAGQAALTTRPDLMQAVQAWM